MGIISWIVLGAISGFIANVIMNQNANVLWTVVLGTIGAVVGGSSLDRRLRSWRRRPRVEASASIVPISVLGAVLILFIYRALSGRRITLRLRGSADRPTGALEAARRSTPRTHGPAYRLSGSWIPTSGIHASRQSDNPRGVPTPSMASR